MAGDISIDVGVKQLQGIVERLANDIRSMRDDLTKQLSESNSKIADLTRQVDAQMKTINDINLKIYDGFEQSTKDYSKLDLSLSTLSDNTREPAVTVPNITLPWR